VYGIFYKLPWTSDGETSGDQELELERGYKYAADSTTTSTSTANDESPEVEHKSHKKVSIFILTLFRYDMQFFIVIYALL
jgi:hypothetical protein